MIDSIVVPVDGSAHANAAVDFASELAAKFGSKLILLNVISRLGSDRVPEGLAADLLAATPVARDRTDRREPEGPPVGRHP